MKKFLIVVDSQYDFVIPGGALYIPTAEEIIVPGIQFLAGLNHEEYEGILYTLDSHNRHDYYDLPESKQFPIHCVNGEPGHHVVFSYETASYRIPHYLLSKGVFSMWEENDLQVFLDKVCEPPTEDKYVDRDAFFVDLKTKVDTVQVMGVASDYCVKWAVDGLLKRGFNVEVIEHLCRGIDKTAAETFSAPEYASVKLI